MSILMRTLKRIALSLAAVVVAFSWSSTGRAQAVPAPCVVERGQDPLDVLNTGVRHNLWIVLDASGSMGDRITLPDGTQSSQNKMQIAKDAINQVMDNLVDSAGRPLVNWGFAHYRDQTVFPVDGVPACPSPLVPPDGNADNYPDTPHGCTGLEDAAFIDPGTCAQDSRELVRSVLNPLRQFRGTGGQSQRTPIGVAFSDFGEYITGRHRPDLGASGNRINFVDTLLPGQKNFLVHITDGLETCECDRGGYPQARLSPLLNSVTMRPSQFDPNQITTATAQDDFRVYNAALKGEWTLKQIDPTLDGSKGNVFVVGFDIQNAIDQGRINTVAWMSSGAGLSPQRDPKLMHSAFFANQPDELEEALRRIVGEIGIPETDVTLGASVVGSVKEVIHSHTNTNVARADVIPNDLTDADAIREARAIRADHQNNVLFSTSAEVPGFRGHLRATSIYTVTDPNLPRTARQADFTEIWDAGDVLQSTDPDTRMMFFNLPGTATVRPFTPAEVIASGLDLGVGRGYLSELDGAGAQDVDDAVEIVVQVMRGYHLSIDPVTRTIYKNNGTLNLSKTDADGNDTWKLWESVGGPSLALNPPRSPDFDPPLNHSTEYGVGGSVEGDGFFWDHFNRRTVVYYTANPGILHGFSAETGEELFAFLPDDALELADLEADRDTIADFVRDVVTDNNNVLNHKFILASPPVVADVFLRSDVGAGTQRGDDAWHTLLAFGRGRGGRFLTLLDVTTAPDDPASLALRWNVGNREGPFVESDPRIDGLGETWSIPAFGNVDTRGVASPDDTEVDQWLVFAGGGYGCVNAAREGEFLFAFQAEDGAIYYRNQTPVATDPAAVIAKNGLVASPTVFIPHREDVADSKDFVTRVYIPDLQGRVLKLDTSDTDPTNWTLNVFAAMGPAHPITAAVTLMNDPFTPNRVFVMAGSGGDRRAPEPAEGFKFRTWIDTDADGQNRTQFLPGDTPSFEQIFNPGERMLVPAVTAGTIGDPAPPVVFFAATSETLDTTLCEFNFSSTLYAVGIESGLPEFDLDVTQPGTGQASLGDVMVQGLFVRDGNLYVTQSGGIGTSGGVSVWGDGSFDDQPAPASFGQYTLMLLVEGFRISPF